MLIRLFIILFVVFLLTGCPADPPEGGSSAGTSRQEEIEKWNTYVDLSNNLETELNPALQNYFRLFGYSPEYIPTDRPEFAADILSAMVANQELAREIDQALAKAAGSDNDLDQATYEMSLHLKQLWAGLVKARDYYAGGGAAPEDYAAMRETHASIFQAYQGLEATRVRFWDVLSKEDAERRKRDIQNMADQGLALRPAMLRLLDSGQALQDLLSGRNITSATLASLNLDDFRPLNDAFALSIADFDLLENETENPAQEGLKAEDLERFSRQAWETLAAANQLIERRQNKDPGEAGADEAVGTPEHFGRELGELVDLYNEIVP